jgi:hypothetical protein
MQRSDIGNDTETMDSQHDTSIIALNNHGARCISHGDYHSAVESLSHALHSSKICVHHPVENSNHATFDISDLMKEGCHAMKDKLEIEELLVQRIAPSDFIYSSPISVPVSAFSNPGLHTEVAISSIVIFNLALAHHLLAIHAQQPHQQIVALLAKSMKLYELAIQLQQQDATLSASNYSTLFILSSLNNLGNVHHMLGDEQASHYCYQKLLSLLMYLSYHEGFSKTSSGYNTLFFRNTLQRRSNAAPAA